METFIPPVLSHFPSICMLSLMLNSWIALTFRLRMTILFVLLSGTITCAQLPAIHRIKVQLNRVQSDSTRALLYLALGEAYGQIQLDSSLHYIRKSIDLAKKQPNERRLLARGLLKLGYSYRNRGDYAKALASFQKAELIQRVFPFDSTFLEIQVQAAIAHRSQGNYSKALQLALAVLQQVEKQPTRSYRQIGMLYTELGIIYDYLQQYTLAMAYHQKRLAFSKKGTHKRDLTLAYINMGAYCININRLEDAHKYYLEALSISKKFYFSGDQAVILQSLGDIAYKRNLYSEAIAYGYKGLQLQKQRGAEEYVGLACLALARSYGALHKYKRASAYVNQAGLIFESIRSAHYLQQVMEVKSQLAAQTGHYKEALQAVLKAQSFKDSLTGLDKQNAIAQVQVRYDLERKQDQIAILNKDLTIQKQVQRSMQLQLKLIQQERLLYLTTALLLALLLSISYIGVRKQKKARQILIRQKEEISQQSQQLAELNATKDKLFSLISHDLRSPMAHLKQNFYQLRADSTASPALVKPLRQLEDQVDRILDLLTNLLDWSHSQLKGFQSYPQSIELTQVTTELVSQLADQLRQKNIVLINQIPLNTVVVADKHQLHSILRNLLSNAVKFTPPEGYVRLQATLLADHVELIIQDTGIGMNSEELAHVLTNPQVRLGTQGELGSGLGLQLSQELLARQSGSLTVSSQPDKGTTFRVRLPADVSLQNVANVYRSVDYTVV